jgi:AbrB family looped-hinge helix DNA binding protein
MTTVKVSPKYQVVIPRDVRDSMGIRAGEKVQVFQFEHRLEIVPVRRLAKMRGFLRGIDTTVHRDKDRV